ncbi:protein mono-ADP-ribosyltransferase PARP14-like [Dreissena polymorpha]|uniref:protein mono-ADP-ribosyltransferase PARP14-like n=1 Tax=Dreissena polymorpha TaxID=45954 RepID=UPI002264C0E1|nr:protein mono-ADP-ribosyltransferase PARP14-like [Dreissena polymorpha]
MGEAPSGKFIVVKWESKHDIDQERLKTFVEVKTKECPTIVTGNIKHAALLVFKTEQGTNILQYQLLDPEFWKVQSISVVEESTSLWVTNIPARCEERDLFRFFTNSVSLDNLKLDTHLKVDHDYFSPEDGVAVVHLKTLTDLNDACKKQKKFKKFKDCQLFLTPFYKDIYGVQKPIDETPFTMDIKDETKLMYMMEFWKEEIEEEIKTLYCTKINWPRDHTICKVKFTFDCHHDDHRSQRGKKWKADVDNKFKDYQEQIKIDARFVDDSIKSEVNGIIDKYTGTKVSVENNLNSNKLLLIGRNKEEEWMVLQKQLDSIQPPEPKATAKVRLESNRPRVIAFKDMGLKHTMEFKSVVVEVDIDGCTISVTGNATEVPNAERNVLKLLADMCEQEVHIPDDDYKQILTTDHMKDEIDKCIKKRGTRCAFVSAGDTMILFSMDNNELIDMEKEVINLIARFMLKLEGRIYRNKEIFEKKIKAIEEEFSSHARLSHQESNTDVKISIVCEQIILRNAIEKIKNELGPLLARKEPLRISDFIVKYIMDNNTISNIRRDIREAKLSENILVIDSELKYLAVEGVEEDRKKVVEIVKKYAHGIYASWRNLSGETIDQYCEKSDFQTFLLQTIKTHSCKFKIARKNELKESLIYCVAVMKSGQAIFVVNASFNDLENADVIVSVTNPELKPGRKGLARDLVDRGGEIIQDKCDERVKLKGSLGISEVFVSDAGKLQCQKIIHAVGPVWQGGQNNEEQMLSVTLENILKVMNNDNEFILRSIATPLIGHGQGKFSAKRSARVMLRTLNDKLKDYPNVREIFLVDFDPKTVRTIQKEMHALFGELCFHTPVENIGFGKGTVVSTKPGLFCLRSGSRRIPLPGGKVLCIKWGKLQDTGTEIIVSPTPTAPLPSGLIINALAAKSVHVDLKSECSKEFKKQPKVENGTIVQTVGPVGSIYHLKIEPKWDQGKGAKNLEDYTKSCLSRAILNKIKFIALPPIGVADNSYPAVDVARTMIRTVALFVKDKPKCSLEEINIVIHDTDMSTTSAFEHVMGEMFSRRPHRLEANILDSVKEKKSLDSVIR